MSKADYRRKKLLEMLFDEKEFKPTKYFSKAMAVSNKTILTDVEQLNKKIASRNLTIEKVPRHGILLKRNGLVFSDVKEIFQDVKNYLGTAEERRLSMFCLFLNARNEIAIETLENTFYVSDATVKKDIEFLYRYLKDYSISFSQSNGSFMLKGNESNIQIAFRNYALNYFENNFSSREELSANINLYFDADLIKAAEAVLNKFRLYFNTEKANQYFASIYLTIITLFTRLSNNHHIYINKNTNGDLSDMQLYMLSYEISDFVSERYGIQFWYQDTYFLSQNLYGLNIEPQNESIDQFDKKYQEAVNYVISEIGLLLGVDLSNDVELAKALLNHLVPMVYRLKRNIYVKNPLFEEIKNRYLLLYSLMCYASNRISQMFEVTLTGDEISFLVIYVQISLERNFGVHFRNIYLLLPKGFITAELIYTKIRRIIPATDNVIMTSAKEFESANISPQDIIVTNSEGRKQLKGIRNNIVVVSALMDSTDIDKIISSYYDDYYNSSNQDKDHKGKWINPKLIFLNKNFSTKNECLDFMIQKYNDLGIVSKKFGHTVYLREKLGDTSFSVNVALPHADPEEVFQTAIGIMTLKNQIPWGVNDVRIVVFLAISYKDVQKAKNVLTDLLEFIESDENREKMLSVTRKEDMVKLLLN
ncbi:MAG: PTS sugar transporter subunit IIA [Enterococcaceae bacterium]|jgi:transcriptional antiterminator/mannitol/fructose-specific phosphotransferase system IIA component|nr:PTS sugar transporter subunit IIA [Enterococcaceae bacterium]MCI1919307.1 PTS sugar transporter subunit IIA [Enterococcaceae bacterium]